MPIDPLPQTPDIRGFETWLIRQINFAHLHYNRLDKKQKDGEEVLESSLWSALGELSALVNCLSYYTDRSPDVLNPVAGDYRALVKAVREGSSWTKQVEREVGDAEERSAARQARENEG